MTTTARLLGIALLLVIMSGCACRTETPEFRSQSIATRDAVRLDIGLTDKSTIAMLLGSEERPDQPQAPDQRGPSKLPQSQTGGMSLVRAGVARATFSDVLDSEADPAPLIETGFIYIVRPPAWPLVRTPATRGGTPLSDQWNGQAYVAAAVTDGVQRIFFLGAFNQNGSSRPNSRMTVGAFPNHPSNPASVTLEVAQYAEAQIVNGVLQITRGEHPVTSPLCPDNIRALMIQIQLNAENNNMPWNPAIVIPPPGAS